LRSYSFTQFLICQITAEKVFLKTAYERGSTKNGVQRQLSAIGNRQLGITHDLSCPAMRTAKVNVMAKLATHGCTISDSTLIEIRTSIYGTR
jgi:hypothetical protein